MLFSVGQQNHTIRGLFITIQSLSFCAPRTVVKSPSDHSSAVPPAAITSSTSIVCTVPGFTRAKSSRRNEQAAVKAETIVSSICRAAANRSRTTLPGTLATCLVSPSLLSLPATMGCCPYSRKSSWTAAVISAAVSFTSVFVSTVVSRLPDGVKARAKCPDGSTVTRIRHRNFVL